MHFCQLLATLLGVSSLTRRVAADLTVTKDLHSFGGVNFPGLQFLNPYERNEAIRKIVESNVRVVRLFIRPYEKHPDPELEIGSFARGLLDIFDDTLAAIHHISKGKVKVIIAPHDAHGIRNTNNVPCDAYCDKLNGAFLDFYTLDEYRTYYKTRLEVFFKEYPSRNFDGRSWSTLNEVILGVDVQNEPWSGIFPIVAGETWLCDIATHLKDGLGLGENNIAVISGGISGAQSVDSFQNFPDSAFDCKALDVIAFHGYYEQKEDETAGTPWLKLFTPGNTLTARAHKENKLLLVEEMSYVNTELGLHYKKQAIWDQGNALNYRGIPWLYSQLTTSSEGTTSRVSIVNDPKIAAIGALKNTLKLASRSRSNFNWAPYISRLDGGLNNATSARLNPYVLEQSDCTFGCEGWLCDSADGCTPDLNCKNSICTKPAESQPGQVGADCNSKAVCQEHLRCEDKVCQPCIARFSKLPANIRLRANPHDKDGACHPDSDFPFLMRNICNKPLPFHSPARRGNPCTSIAHCDINEFCDWGLCKPCTEGCLGMTCRTNNKCKSGFCNNYGFCDLPGLKKVAHGPGAWAGKKPKEAERGQAGGTKGNKVLDVPVKVNIPKDKVMETGKAVPT